MIERLELRGVVGNNNHDAPGVQLRPNHRQQDANSINIQTGGWLIE